MPTPKLKITNPRVIELINRLKSGKGLESLKSWTKKNRWYLIAAGVVVVFSSALVVGKILSESNPVPTFTPPEIEINEPTMESTIKSTYSGLKQEIQNLNTDLPDPYIPSFDNAINLDEQSI